MTDERVALPPLTRPQAWFARCSRAPTARLLRAERRRLDAELADDLPASFERIRRRVDKGLAGRIP
ncbi:MULTISPECIES: hypothetical protein [unclassified Kitasatospora]|uniref:hypothetical protein n=1 Tax=unclassified Kitasatospora TaxID=2633591 RepID=UPI000CDC7DA0|nr:hypothetical protein [Kitasatospora sp. RG8]AUY47859.1 hypothetical protein C2142_01500 [Streptomyces sp. CB01881]